MAGLIAPYDVYTLIRILKETVQIPIHLHSHFTSGMADMSMLKAIEAGVDIIDVCLSPWAYRTSHPALEPLVVALKGTSRDTGFDLKQLTKCAEHFNAISPKYRHLLDDRMSVIDTNVLLHQTPGGMLSNLVNQLREMDAIDKLEEVFQELPRVRKELGQVPLVTPTSQIVGTQTVNNVLFDTPEERYKMITSQVKDLCYGLYGRTPAPIDTEVQKKALQGYPRGEEPITCRPADILEPELEKARQEIKDLAKDIDDVLIYALYPTTGKRYLRWKYGLEEMPDEIKPKTLSDVQQEQDLIAKAKKGFLVDASSRTVPQDNQRQTINITITNAQLQIDMDASHTGALGSLITSSSQPASNITAQEPASSSETSQETSQDQGTPVEAPMPGMIVSFEVDENERIEEGDILLILEAMKMENTITSPVSGTVKKLMSREGDNVQKGDILVIIEE
jgi:pyruvate carboxylase subunit B